MRRRLLLIFTSLLACAIAALATLPWWLGTALGAAGRPRGLPFARYERIGCARFALREVDVRWKNAHVPATRVEANTPLVWLWHRATNTTNFISADHWTVEVGRPAGAAKNPSPGGWLPLRTTLGKNRRAARSLAAACVRRCGHDPVSGRRNRA